VILHDGKIVAEGCPMEIFATDMPFMEWGMEVPLEAELQRLEALGSSK
jgi:hypothetical protein